MVTGQNPPGHVCPGHLPPGHLPPGHIPPRTYTPKDISPPPRIAFICDAGAIKIFALSGMVRSV